MDIMDIKDITDIMDQNFLELMGMPTFHYKCRMEVVYDFARFITWYTNVYKHSVPYRKYIHILDHRVLTIQGTQDCEWEFVSNVPFPKIKALFKKADKELWDLHVMVESLKPLHLYDGEREEACETECGAPSVPTQPCASGAAGPPPRPQDI